MAAKGLNWLAAVQPSDIANSSDRRIAQLKPGAAVLLFFALGPSFGRQTLAGRQDSDMFDRRSRELAMTFAERYLDDNAPILLYPAAHHFALAPWLAAANAYYTSPLGLGIRSDAGLWLAVRAALLVNLSPAQLAELRHRYPPIDPAAASPCDTCNDKPCISACPGGAVSARQIFNGGACAGERLRENSGCAETCLSRLACPVGANQRYDKAQIAYHYRLSLNAIRAWRSGANQSELTN